jgi:mannitol/fructose-specific phosphotransferase system IIA component
MGEGVELPHGTDDSPMYLNFSQFDFVTFANPGDWEGEKVKLCIGIAAKGDEHGELLGNLADKLLDESSYSTLMNSASEQEILDLLNA